MKTSKLKIRMGDKATLREIDAYPVTEKFWVHRSISSNEWSVTFVDFGNICLQAKTLKAAKDYAQVFQDAFNQFPFSAIDLEFFVKTKGSLKENLRNWIETARQNVLNYYDETGYEYRLM